MPLTVAQFQARFPEFVSAPEALIQVCLDEAYQRTPEHIWRELMDPGAAYLAAHLLSLRPQARPMTVSADGTTQYLPERRRMMMVVTSGHRVVGRVPDQAKGWPGWSGE